MAKPTTKNESTIDKLLEDRSQFVTWLARLETSSDAVPAVPEPVRIRVRADYAARLQAVQEELRTHETTLREQLEEYRARRTELTHRESQAKEQMAEAEIRHAVGEFDEHKWQNIRGETTRILVAVREELQRTSGEIDRLGEVLDSVLEAPEAVEPEPMPVPVMPVAAQPVHHAPPLTPTPVVPHLTVEPEPVRHPAPEPVAEMPFKPMPSSPTPRPAPRPVPKPKEDTPGRTLWFPSGKSGDNAAGGNAGKLDELAFLKSVTGSDAPPPAKRASGGFAKAPEPPAAPAAPVSQPIMTAEPFANKQPPGSPDMTKERGSAANAPKTLKCGECGTMNRPTEWYCERCGAELAAL